MNGGTNDDRSRSLDGVDPQAAADELRAILAASGEGEGIVAQLGALVRLAERFDRGIGRGFDLSQAKLGGLEHYVWKDETERVVKKFTYGGSFGRTVRSIESGLGCDWPYAKKCKVSSAFLESVSRVFPASNKSPLFPVKVETPAILP